MKTTFVYRIEHSKHVAKNTSSDKKFKNINLGPYIGTDCEILNDMSSSHNIDLTHPSIRTDITNWYKIDDKYNYVCCFKTKKQMKAWFKGWFGVLHSEGFVLVKYIIKKDGLIMGYSNRQAIFYTKKVIERKVVGYLVNIK